MRYEKEYFEETKYSQRGQLVMKHVEEVLKWGSKTSHINLLDGHGKTALDVGCAYGYGVAVLNMLGYESCGVDISKHSVGQAKKGNPDIDVAVCDVQDGFPFVEEAFDVVTCFEVLEHLTSPLRAIRSMLSSCRQVMICTTPNKVVEKPVKKMVRDFDKTHITVRTPHEWERDLSKMAKNDEVWVESFLDSTLRVSDKLLFFKSFRIPYVGLDTRILIRKSVEARQ